MLPLNRRTTPAAAWRATRTAAIAPPGTSTKRSMSIQKLDDERKGRERVVILGSGWAGYTLSRALNPKKFQVVIVSPRSYFVFTPLLASTSVGTLEFRTALEPVRSRRTKAEFFQAWADSVDFDQKTLTVEEAVEDPLQGRSLAGDRHADESVSERALQRKRDVEKGKLFSLAWDKLVVAVGCYSQTFNTEGVKEHAYFLKDVGDARRIRNRLLSCFETAALPTTPPALRDQLLNFAVVGGGPTGIEWSAELHDLIHEDMARLFPDLVPHARITVYDVAPRVLSMFDESLSKYAMDHFHRQGISIQTNHHVQSLAPAVDGGPTYTLTLAEDGPIGVGMCVWSTGLMTNPFLTSALASHTKQDPKSHLLLTTPRLQAQHPNTNTPIPSVYALGDCATIEATSYPATAQVAAQKAAWLAKRLNKSDIETREFTYKDLGVMAYVGNWNAILQSQGGDVSGRVAWLIWRGAYLTKSVSWRNKVLIPVYWFLNWAFGRDTSRF